MLRPMLASLTKNEVKSLYFEQNPYNLDFCPHVHAIKWKNISLIKHSTTVFMVDLLNYSVIIIGLAIFGFILKDTYYASRKYCTPYEVKNSTDSYFSHISVAILIISVCWIWIILPLMLTPDAEPILRGVLENFAKLAEFGILTEEEVINYFNGAFFGLYLFTWFALVYAAIYCITFILGLLAVYFNSKSIVVTYHNQEQQEYQRIILESGNFIYFERSSDFRNWVGIPKESIIKIESKVSKSRFDKIISKRFSKRIENHKILGSPKKRALALLSCLGLLAVLAVSAQFTEHFILRILLIIILVPIAILTLIDKALN